MPNERLVFDNKVLRIDKGRTAPPSEDEQEPRGSQDEHIPWGYGRDRLTAMAVDPNRLYLYWELTDPALEKAREGLGAAQKESWVNLRIYDVTGRIFDGTNAHSYFDIKVDRSDRQWFAHIGKPASSLVAEIGAKSLEGYFVKVSRSGRVDFPRFEPSPDGTVEWLTVRTATGPVGGSVPSAPSGGGAERGVDESGGAPPSPPEGRAGEGGAETLGMTNGLDPATFEEWSWTGWEQIFHSTWHELLRAHWIAGRPELDWSTPPLHASWESGPFSVPIECPVVTEEHHQGPVTVVPLPNGRTRIVYGPWQVVVRGVSARAEKRVIARWEVAASWVVEMGFERVVRTLTLPESVRAAADGRPSPAQLGASEHLGASERLWLSASEMRLRGASELYGLGASELRMRGASEALFGASERRFGGASETAWHGASELRLGGASDGAYPYPREDANVTSRQG